MLTARATRIGVLVVVAARLVLGAKSRFFGNPFGVRGCRSRSSRWFLPQQFCVLLVRVHLWTRTRLQCLAPRIGRAALRARSRAPGGLALLRALQFAVVIFLCVAGAQRVALAGPATLYLNFATGSEALERGPADAADLNISELCKAETLVRWNGAEDCEDRETCRVRIAGLVQDYLWDFDVTVAIERPQKPYTMVMVGPASGNCQFGVQGLAVNDCENENDSNIGFAFECMVSSTVCAGVIAHEYAHTLGLVHVRGHTDIMSLGIDETPVSFQDQTFATVDPADCGNSKQNSYQSLMAVVGPWTGDRRLGELLSGEQRSGRPPPGCGLRASPVDARSPWYAWLCVGGSVVASLRRRRSREVTSC